MPKQHKNTKLVYDPLWGLIDITDYLPMIDVPEFQALGFKYQLGIANLLFPAATHTRKEHSFGAFRRTQELAFRWQHYGFINQEQANLMNAYALWHDIGHGPFSHVVEEITKERWGRDHNQNGVLIADRLKDVMEEIGIDFDKLRKFFTRENPLYLGVSDKNLGAEKLDYLSRDAYYTIGEKPGVEYLARHTYFIDNQVVIDEKAIDNAKALQEFYIKMYKVVYLRKNSAIAQRLVQSIIHDMLEHEKMAEEDLWALTDFGLLGKFENSPYKPVRAQTQNLLARRLPRTAIAFKIEQFADIEKRKDKAQTILSVTENQMAQLNNNKALSTPSQLKKLEKDIAELAQIPSDSVLIVPSISTERLVPKDVKIYVPGGNVANLSEYFADHFRAIEEEGKSYNVIRICAHEEFRERLSDPEVAREVKRYMLSLTQ